MTLQELAELIQKEFKDINESVSTWFESLFCNLGMSPSDSCSISNWPNLTIGHCIFTGLAILFALAAVFKGRTRGEITAKLISIPLGIIVAIGLIAIEYYFSNALSRAVEYPPFFPLGLFVMLAIAFSPLVIGGAIGGLVFEVLKQRFETSKSDQD